MGWRVEDFRAMEDMLIEEVIARSEKYGEIGYTDYALLESEMACAFSLTNKERRYVLFNVCHRFCETLVTVGLLSSKSSYYQVFLCF